MTLFVRTFWLSFLAMALASFAAVHAWWSFYLDSLPPCPPFPATHHQYIAVYGDWGYASHYLYRFGMFGIKKRIQQSDVFLLGASHVEFGLSAAQLSREFTASMGRPIRVYNLGLGYGESLPFDDAIFATNDIRHKAAIVDLYMPWGSNMSRYGAAVDSKSTIEAYWFVGKLWLRAFSDWVFDPWLPSFGLNKSIKPVRMLRYFTVRDWDTGDLVNVWRPETGFIFAPTQPTWSHPVVAGASFIEDELKLTPELQAELKDRDIRPIYTLIPFDGYLPNRIPALAQPYVPIASTDLTTLDRMHLNGSSRKIATERLFQGIDKGVGLSPYLPSPAKP